MTEQPKIHHKTLQACEKYNIDVTQYTNVTELRLLIAEKRYAQLRETHRDYWKEKMRDRYRADPQKYRDQKNKSRVKLKEQDSEKFLKKQTEWSLKYYYKQKEKSKEHPPISE
jgi:hypothetical protein